ncbi:MAG: fimbrillin family protein [Muribaculaceae bacterium]|nr:fimbrillin family protein [Muribaculaceae bacterium]
MRNKVYYAIIGIILTVALNSCGEEKEVERQEIGERVIRLFVNGIETRTNEGNINQTTLQNGNTVGAFGVFMGEDSTITNGNNNEYSVNQNGELKAASEEMSAQENTENVKIVAYAPYNSNWNEYYNEYDFTVATDQSREEGYLASDLLYAEGEKIDKVTLDQEPVNLTFKHKLARIQLNINLDEEVKKNFNGANVIVNNTRTSISFNPSTGKLGVEAIGEPNDITAVSGLDSEKKAYAVVVPQKVSGGTVLFTIKLINEKQYTLTLSNNVTFEEGKSYSFTANIKDGNSGNIEIKLDPAPIVDDWDDGNEGEEGEIESLPLEQNYFNVTNGKGEGYLRMDWNNNYLLSWSVGPREDTYLTILSNSFYNNIRVYDCLKYNSLVFKIENFTASNKAKDVYLIVGSSINILFKISENEIFKIDGNGTFAIDLNRFRNKEVLVGTTQINLYGNGDYGEEYPDPKSSAKISNVYLTTQKAENINKN